jgi:hypothetical protein
MEENYNEKFILEVAKVKYEYKFVEVPLREKGFKTKLGEGFDRCKEIIIEEAANGWRLKQIVIPANEKTGVAAPYCYQIVFVYSLYYIKRFSFPCI